MFKLLSFILSLVFLFSSSVFAYDNSTFSSNELKMNSEHTEFNEPCIEDLELDMESIIEPLSTSYANDVFYIGNTNIVLQENGSVNIPYTVYDTSYTINFWAEGSRNYTMTISNGSIRIVAGKAEKTQIMVHYRNAYTGDEGHTYINICVYPRTGYVYFDNIASGKCLDVRGAYTTDGAKTIIYSKYSTIKANQVWRILPQSDGTVKIKSVLYHNRYLHINPSTQKVESSSTSSLWNIVYDTQSSAYCINPANSSNQYVVVENDSTDSDSEIQVMTGRTYNSRKWNLNYISSYVPVTGISISSPTTNTNFTEPLSTGTINLVATLSPSSATNPKVTWRTGDSTVATVNATTGKVQLKKEGTVTIYCNANDGTCSDYVRINVIDNYYYFQNFGNDRYLDISNSGTADGTPLLHWSGHYAYNQIIHLEKRGTDTFSLHPMPSMMGKALTVGSNGRVSLANYTGASNQLFRFEITSMGWRRGMLVSLSNNKALVPSSTSDYIELQTKDSSNYNHLWEMESYKEKALNTLNYAAFSLNPDSEYGYLAYNTFLNQMSNFALNGTNYRKMASWQSKVTGTNNVRPLSKAALLEIIPYADIVYIDSHATSAGIYFVNGLGGTDYITYDDLGANFKSGSNTKTDSIFNKKTKWVIISACSQLDKNGSALEWAKLCLGDGQRLHGVLSYYSDAPGDEKFNQILSRVFSDQSANSNTLINSWATKNYYSTTLFNYEQNWAIVYHDSNAADRLNSMTTTTTNGSSYTIKRKAKDQATPQNIVLSTSNISNTSNVSAKEDIISAFDTCIRSSEPISVIINDNIQISRDEDGAVFYQTTTPISNNLNMTLPAQNVAVQEVFDSLYSLGIVKNTDFDVWVSPITESLYDADSDSFINETTLYYEITFVKTNTDGTQECIKSIYKNGVVESFCVFDN